MQSSWVRDPLSPPYFFCAYTVLQFLAPYAFARSQASSTQWVQVGPMRDNVVLGYHIDLAMLCVLIFSAAWFLAFQLSDSLTRQRALKSWMRLSGGVSEGAVVAFGAMVLFSFLLAFYLHPSRGADFRSDLTDGAYGQVFFLIVTIYIGYLGYLFASRLSARISFGSLSFLALVLLLSVAILWMLGGRGRAVAPVLMFIVCWHYFKERIALGKLVSAGVSIVLALVLLPILVKQSESGSLMQSAFGTQGFRNFDALYNLSLVVRLRLAGDVAPTYGAAQLCDVLSDLGLADACRTSRTILMQDVYGVFNTKVGFTLSKPGEFYLSFGWAGLVVGGAALGAFALLTYDRFVRWRIWGVASIPAYFFTVMRGGFSNPASYFAQNLVLLAIQLLVMYLLYFALDSRTRLARSDGHEAFRRRVA